MKRESSQDKETKQSKQESTEVDQKGTTEKRPKFSAQPDTSDLGAGYDCEDKRVARAIKTFETKLLPYIEENSSLFRHSNFIALKGYATGIPSPSGQ